MAVLRCKAKSVEEVLRATSTVFYGEQRYTTGLYIVLSSVSCHADPPGIRCF